MLGAVVYILTAEQSGWLPEFTGRVMHGVFFRMLQEASRELASYVHEQMKMKPFTVSALQGKKYKSVRGKIYVSKGDVFQWRVTGLHESILQVMLQAEPGYMVRVNSLPMQVKALTADGEQNPRAGFLAETDLLGLVLGEENFSRLTIDFLSPTAFRVDVVDYPMPLPGLVFPSLAEKWQQLDMPAEIDRAQVKEIAEKVYIEHWSGRTRSVYLTPRRGVNTFTGTFSYNLSQLPMEERQVLLLLAQFGVFAGCGRMAGQGLGQMQVTYH
ncbi:MAG: CRISPR system precrRNA processing endoribonuclease RAMP protein Cas6 [Anaerovibrio sp.]